MSGPPCPSTARQFPSADKTLVLAAGGYVIDAARGTPRSPGFYLSRQDCNELAMLTRPGTKVTILRGKERNREAGYSACQ